METSDLFLFDAVNQKSRYIYTCDQENINSEIGIRDVLIYTESQITIERVEQYEEQVKSWVE